MNIDNIRAKKADILAVTNDYGVQQVLVFGSFLHGNNKPGSDLDLLVSLKKNLSLLKLARLERLLTEKLGVPVQIITENALNPLIKSQVMAEAAPL